jgi:hypothetical protein
MTGVCCTDFDVPCWNTFNGGDLVCAQEGTMLGNRYAAMGSLCKSDKWPIASNISARLCCDFGNYPLPDGRVWNMTNDI